jgi:D-psicose/D-tagatose/L-ribulose 3-epimerase
MRRAAGLRPAEEIGVDNVVIPLDSYHMTIEEDDLVRPLRHGGTGHA